MPNFYTEKIEIVRKKTSDADKRKRFFSGTGITIGILRIIDGWVSKLFKRGTTAAGMCGYEHADDRLKHSGIAECIRRTRAAGKNFRLKLAGYIERAYFVKLFDSFFKSAPKMKARQIGSFLLSFGGYSVIVYCIKRFATDSVPEIADLICGIAVTAAAIPLLLSSKSVVTLAQDSSLFGGLLQNIGDDMADESVQNDKSSYQLTPALIAGIVCGLFTLKTSSLAVLGGIACVIGVLVLLKNPEIGIPIITAAIPFSVISSKPSTFLALVVISVAVSYICKLFHGKRALTFGFSEIAPTLLLVAILLSAVPGKYEGSIKSAIMSSVLMLSGLLTVCLVKTRKNLEFTAAIVVLSSTLTALIGIMQFVLGLSPSGWIDTQTFPEITSRVTSVFANPNMLGFYLVTVFPFSLYAAGGYNRFVSKNSGVISVISIIACAILTWSRSTWIGMIAGSFVFFATLGLRKIFLFVPAAGAVYIGAGLFPGSFGKRITFFTSIGDSANYYRKAIWSGVVELCRRIWVCGIGAGDMTFSVFYIGFSHSGIEGAVHSHSMLLQLVIETGIIGLILFVFCIITSCRKAGWAMLKFDDKRSAVCAGAAIAAVIGLCASGVFDNVLYNYRVLCAFWTMLGLSSAAANICRDGYSENRMVYESDSCSSDVEIRITGGM